MTDFSFQLYSARNYPHYSDVYALLADAGYKQVEGFAGVYGDLDQAGLDALKAELDARGLSMPTGHFSIELLENDPQRALAIARTLGMRSVYCPWLAPEERPTDAAGWHALGARLEKAGKPIREAGFDFGWHNHDFEFFPLEDGSMPLDQIFAGGPSLSWEADIAWVVRGKDIAPAGENTDEDGWADVGHGTVPWDKLLPALRNTPARHFIVEHDNPNDLGRLVRHSIASLKTY